MTSTAPVLRAITVSVAPETAFRVFTEQLGAWWPIATHGTFGERCASLAIEDDRIVERSIDGEAVVWGEVLVSDAPRRLLMTWHPGREAADASEVEVRFVPDRDGTRVELEHRGWERFGTDAARRRRVYVRPGAWGAVLEHYADLAEPRPDASDLSALEAAYDSFFAEASHGGHGAPPEGEWDAGQVIAHVTLNDLAMIAVVNAIIHDRPTRFENVWCQDRDVLAAHLARFDNDLTAAIAHGRRVAEGARAAYSRLSPKQGQTLVPCRLLHDGEVVLDQPMPWSQINDTLQAARHLPAHTGQLRDLRD